jgi:GST-like protein
MDLKTEQTQPIELYTWPTPNGHKVHIFLEESGVPYNVHAINIGEGDQFKPDFLAISPNNKMPAITDPEGPGGQPYSLFESGAILMYLAEKFGVFWPQETTQRYDVVQWLMFQMASVGPMLGQCHHFRMYAPEKLEYAINRYTNEATRIYNVIDIQLEGRDFVCGEYSIADMAIFPWILPWERQGQDLDKHPNMKRWYETMKARPGVRRGCDVLKERRMKPEERTDKANDILFGKGQLERKA